MENNAKTDNRISWQTVPQNFPYSVAHSLGQSLCNWKTVLFFSNSRATEERIQKIYIRISKLQQDPDLEAQSLLSADRHIQKGLWESPIKISFCEHLRNWNPEADIRPKVQTQCNPILLLLYPVTFSSYLLEILH